MPFHKAMRRLLIVSILAFYILGNAHAQSTNRPYIINKLQHQESGQGSVQIVQDKKLDDLLGKIVERNAQRGTVPGYRIQIFRENSQVAQERARGAQSKFISNFPDIPVYSVAKAPLWRVYVGDFLTLNQVIQMKKQIEPLFPNAFYIHMDLDYNKL